MRILIQFVNSRLNPFRFSELRAIMDMYGMTIEYDATAAEPMLQDMRFFQLKERPLSATPFLIATVASEAVARAFIERSMLVVRVLDLWCFADTLDELHAAVRTCCETDRAAELAALAGTTFKFDVQAFMRSIAQSQAVSVIRSFADEFPLFQTAKVQLREPQSTYTILFDHTVRQSPDYVKVYFGREIGQQNCRGVLNTYRLNRRPYIGTTSMDPELSFIVANHAHARPNALILDPFVGTGSLLVSCAHFGALTVGTDIDFKVLRGKSVTQTHQHNYRHYGFKSLQLFGLAVADLAHLSFRTVPMFDAIVGDPPYGIRAGGRKLGVKPRSQRFTEKRVKRVAARQAQLAAEAAAAANATSTSSSTTTTDNPTTTASTSTNNNNNNNNSSSNNAALTLPQCVAYSVSEACADLLALAARVLVIGGRLVYWLPSTRKFQPSDLPLHPCLEIVSYCVLVTSSTYCRVLVTMRKAIAWNEQLHSNPDRSLLGQFGTPAHADLAAHYFDDKNRRDNRHKKKTSDYDDDNDDDDNDNDDEFDDDELEGEEDDEEFDGDIDDDLVAQNDETRKKIKR